MNVMPSRWAAMAIGTTGKPTMPNMKSTPCCLRLRAMRVAPVMVAMSRCSLKRLGGRSGDDALGPQGGQGVGGQVERGGEHVVGVGTEDGGGTQRDIRLLEAERLVEQQHGAVHRVLDVLHEPASREVR